MFRRPPMKRLVVVLPVLVLLFSIESSLGGVPSYSPTVAPVTLEVTNGSDDGPGSLRQAIRDATPDSTIEFTFTGTISLTSDELLIDKNLTIMGPGSSMLTISRKCQRCASVPTARGWFGCDRKCVWSLAGGWIFGGCGSRWDSEWRPVELERCPNRQSAPPSGCSVSSMAAAA